MEVVEVPPPSKFKKFKIGDGNEEFPFKTWYESLTPRKPGVLKDSVSYEFYDFRGQRNLWKSTLTFLVL